MEAYQAIKYRIIFRKEIIYKFIHLMTRLDTVNKKISEADK